jgi:hypothetical protein
MRAKTTDAALTMLVLAGVLAGTVAVCSGCLVLATAFSGDWGTGSTYDPYSYDNGAWSGGSTGGSSSGGGTTWPSDGGASGDTSSSGDTSTGGDTSSGGDTSAGGDTSSGGDSSGDSGGSGDDTSFGDDDDGASISSVVRAVPGSAQ